MIIIGALYAAALNNETVPNSTEAQTAASQILLWASFDMYEKKMLHVDDIDFVRTEGKGTLVRRLMLTLFMALFWAKVSFATRYSCWKLSSLQPNQQFFSLIRKPTSTVR